MGMGTLRWEDLPHYTYKDYIQWEGAWELIQGIPYAMTPAPKIRHQRLSTKITQYLGELLKDCNECEALLPVDWQISEDTVVQPDVLVVCPDSRNIGDEKLEITPVLIFEVLSSSTSQKDKVVKYQLYENAGVTYYCLVDPVSISASVYVLENEKYRFAGDYKQGQTIFNLGPCRIQFNFSEIFNLNFA